MIEEQQHENEPETPEQIALRMEELRVEKLELEQKARREQKQREKLVEERREMLFADELRRAIARSGVDAFFLSDSEVKTALEVKLGAKFLIRDTGEFAVEIEGRPAEFSKLIERLAVGSPNLVRDREKNLAHLLTPKERLSREDFPDTASKAKFIEEHGLRAWENLNPTRRPNPTLENLTAEDYKKMSIRDKVALGLMEQQVSDLLRYGKL